MIRFSRSGCGEECFTLTTTKCNSTRIHTDNQSRLTGAAPFPLILTATSMNSEDAALLPLPHGAQKSQSERMMLNLRSLARTAHDSVSVPTVPDDFMIYVSTVILPIELTGE